MQDPANIDNKELVKRLQKGDLHAFDELYRKYSKKLLFFTLGYISSNEDAEDIIQEVFLKVWKNHNQLKEHLSFNSYVFTIAYNAIKKYYRKKGIEKKHFELFLDNHKLIDNDTISKVEYNDLTSRVEKIVNTFPDRRKEVFQLSRESHLSNQEIADKLSITKKTVENHITTSLKVLRKKLKMHLFFLVCLSFF
jgi:RNA polymerase sigma-70 factor (ECF subfamily)